MRSLILTALSLCLGMWMACGACDARQETDRLKWFRSDRFGMFIHWGLYSIPARGEWVMNTEKIPIETYEKFREEFNPTDFDARKVVSLAKRAGMKYIVITTKHHDGFCMFDSALTDYTSMNTPAKRDFIGEIVKACHDEGIRIGFYYSLMDWHHPNYNYWKRPDYPADWNRYIEFLKDQLKELCTKYGNIDIVWFDGGWDKTSEEWHSKEIDEMIRRLQPGILINDRSGYNADFSTPEQTVPGAGLGGERVFESCITINGSWGYNRTDKNFKSTADLIRLLADIAGKGGNLLLNVGPTEKGEIQPEFVERLQGVGEWLERNAESIYGTQAGPFRVLPFGRCTVRGSRLYLHIFDWPSASLVVEGLKNRVKSARLLATRQKVDFRQQEGKVSFTLPPAAPDPADSVLAVEVEGRPSVDAVIRPEPDGSFLLPAMFAVVRGSAARYQTQPDSIGYWTDAKDRVSWEVFLNQPGTFEVEITYACDKGTGGTRYAVREGRQEVSGQISETGAWDRFITEKIGRLSLSKGRRTLEVCPLQMPGYAVMNLQRIRLIPSGAE